MEFWEIKEALEDDGLNEPGKATRPAHAQSNSLTTPSLLPGVSSQALISIPQDSNQEEEKAFEF